MIPTSEQLQQFVWAIRELGLTTIVTLVFLGVFIGWIKSPITETHIAMVKLTEATMDAHDIERRYREEHIMSLRELVRAQVATCAVQAKSVDDRKLCFEFMKERGGH